MAPTEQLDHPADAAGPSRLMAGAEARAVIAMEILVEEQAIPPVRVALEFLGSPVHRPPARLVAQKDADQPIGDLAGDLEEVHQHTRARRAFDLEGVAVVQIVLQHGADQQGVHRHPYRAAPVGIAAEHAAVRLGRQVLHAILRALGRKHEGMIGVVARQRANAMRAQEFALVQHARQDPAQPIGIDDRHDAASALAEMAGPRCMDAVEEVRHPASPFRDGGNDIGHERPLVRFDDRYGAKRQQAHDGADLQAARAAIGKPQDIVIESVLLVPHAVRPGGVHRPGDPQELLAVLGRHILVRRIARGQLDADFEHVLAVQRHPRRAVGLLEIAAGRQRRAAIEDADIVEAEKAALVEVLAEAVLAVRPPGEVQRQLGEGAGEERLIAPAHRLFRPVQEDRRPGMHRRIDVAEIPFIGGNLSGRMEVEALQQEIELLLGEVDIDDRERDGLKGEIPGGEPGIFPLVRHRDDMLVDHVRPVAVSHRRCARFPRIDAMFLEPFRDIEEIVLLAPQHPGQGLPHHVRGVSADTGGRQMAVERVGLALALCQDSGEAVERIAEQIRRRIGQSQADDGGLPGAHRHLVVRGRLGPDLLRIDRVLPPRRDEVVDAVLGVGGRIRRAEEAPIVRLVLGEEQRRPAFAIQVVGPELGIGRSDDAVAVRGGCDFQGRLRRFRPPAPDIAEPQ